MERELLVQSIFSTLAYAAVFDSAVRIRDMVRFLHTSKRYRAEELRATITVLVQQKQLKKSGSWIAHSTGASLLVPSKQRFQESQVKRQHLQNRLFLITWIPWIHGVGITGSVAIGNAHPDDDIDLLIVTHARTLWITRLVVTLILGSLGFLRFSQSHQVKNKWCLNMWIEEDALLMTKRSLYVAREIVQVVWAFDRKKVRERFLRENGWVANYLGNVSLTQVRGSAGPVSPRISRIFTAINVWGYRFQRWYMQRKQTREVVTPSRAFFHPQNREKTTLRDHQHIFQAYLKGYTR